MNVYLVYIVHVCMQVTVKYTHHVVQCDDLKMVAGDPGKRMDIIQALDLVLRQGAVLKPEYAPDTTPYIFALHVHVYIYMYMCVMTFATELPLRSDCICQECLHRNVFRGGAASRAYSRTYMYMYFKHALPAWRLQLQMKGTKVHNPRAILSLLKFVSSA